MSLAKMPLVINGTDFSGLTDRLGYAISYEDRRGGNTMTMQNGDEYLDVIVRKPVLRYALNSLTASEIALLHAAINAAVYVSVTYFDTATSTARTALFHGTISEQEIGAIRNGGYYRFRGPVLSFRAR